MSKNPSEHLQHLHVLEHMLVKVAKKKKKLYLLLVIIVCML